VAVPLGLRLRSLSLLGILSVLIGLLVAAALASAIGFTVQALLHAVGNGP
jgi:ABC-type Co2+ transport system permease subunit